MKSKSDKKSEVQLKTDWRMSAVRDACQAVIREREGEIAEAFFRRCVI